MLLYCVNTGAPNAYARPPRVAPTAETSDRLSSATIEPNASRMWAIT